MDNDSFFSRHFGLTQQVIKHYRNSIVALFMVIVVGFAMFVYGAATGATTDALFIVGLVMLLLGIIGAVVLLVYLKRKGGNSSEQHVMRSSGNTLEHPIEEELQWNKAQNYILINCKQMFNIADENSALGLSQQTWISKYPNPHIPGAVVFMNDKYRVNIVKCKDDDCDHYKHTLSVAHLSSHNVGLAEVIGPQIINYNGDTFEIIITKPYTIMLSDILTSNSIRKNMIDEISNRLPEILNHGNVHLHNIALVGIRGGNDKYVKFDTYLVDIDPYDERSTKQANAYQLIDEIQKVNNRQSWVDSRLIPELEKIRNS
jgi:hypothetical protein